MSLNCDEIQNGVHVKYEYEYERKNYFCILGLTYSSQSKNIVKIHLQVEKWTEMLDFIFSKIMFYGTAIPMPIFCFYLYYTTDLGPNAFQSPFPLW